MLTTTQRLNNPEYAIRMQALNDARRNTGTITPCQQDPQTWDAIDLEYSYHTNGGLTVSKVDMEREMARIERALEGCRACPMLAMCEPLVDQATDGNTHHHAYLKVDAEGVIGGVLIDSTKAAQYVGHYLSTGEWPGRIKLKEPDGDEGTA